MRIKPQDMTIDDLENVYKLWQVANTLVDADFSVHRVPVDIFLKFTQKYGLSYYTQKSEDYPDYYVCSNSNISLYSSDIEGEETEVTLEEVAEKMNIPVEKLRIKEKE